MHKILMIALLILVAGAFGHPAPAQNSQAAGSAALNGPSAGLARGLTIGHGCPLRFEPGPGEGAAGPDAAAPDRPHHITVHVTRSDDHSVISGPVTITGMPVGNAPFDVGSVDWAVSGSTVSGTVTGHDGSAMTTFEGTISDAGVSGSFAFHGKSGKWSWEGPRPQ